MTFLAQVAAWGLLTLPIILILHLLRNRREQLPISSLRLWRGLQQKKHGSLPRSIPLSVLLMLQLLIATALTLALARPVFSFLLDQPRQTIFILDTTTSMAAVDTGSGQSVRRFDAARQTVRNTIQALGQRDAFVIIGLGPQPEVLLSGEAEQKTQALLALDNLVPGATGADLPAALTLANGLLDPSRLQQIIVLTDGAYTVPSELLPPISAPIDWQIIPSSPPRLSAPSNQALLNVSSRTLPDGRHRLFARVINYSDTSVARTVQVFAGERLFDETVVQLQPQGESARVWTLPAPVETARVTLVEPDSLPLDNEAEVLLLETTRQRVLLVSDTPDTLSRALSAQPGIELTVDTPAGRRYDSADFDLTVFEGVGLPLDLTAWPAGNLWVVNPPLGHPLLPADNFSRNLRPDPATGSTLLAGADLSGVYFNRVLQVTLPEWAEVDLRASAGGQPLIFHGTTRRSQIVVWAFDLAASNLPARLALPLLTANTLQTLLSPAPQPVVPLGEPVVINGNFSIEVPGGRRLSSLEAEGSSGIFTRTKLPGLYKIYNDQGALVAGFAVHAGSALESNLAPQFQPSTFNLQPSTSNALPPEIEYYEIWPWLAGLVVTVVMLEGWLAWRK
ncbi:MAG: VWA domain-containing protein [Anaerolineales bacterium]|nr:VWA domain-containing protein [Anaerolineales bacterium]